MKKLLVLFLLVTTVMMTSCKSKYPNLDNGLYAEFVTNKGTFVAKLYNEATPLTVANFIELAEGNHPMVDSVFKGKPFYNNLTFHRVMKDFMIQGGDHLGTGSGNPGYRFPDEFVDTLKHDRKGLLSMANGGPATNSSQFFITLKETPWLNGFHTIFGEIVVGQEIVDAIGLVETAGVNAPVDPVIIQEVTIIKKGVSAPNFTEEMENLENAKTELVLKQAKLAESTVTELNALRPEAETLDSGLEVYWRHKGKGVKPEDGSKIRINYSGFFNDGKLLDTSILEIAEKYNKVDAKRLAQGLYSPMVSDYGKEAKLIPGFKEGLNLMSLGDKIVIFIPSHLAYGEQGAGSFIPPNSDLIFELELVDLFEEE
ncbi:MAG: peptidylprolyl isomerase [Flavobacteriaceae bacterium]|nr:peptidylprolyl isomerase [Flavobacteriaceae bacterium]